MEINKDQKKWACLARPPRQSKGGNNTPNLMVQGAVTCHLARPKHQEVPMHEVTSP